MKKHLLLLLLSGIFAMPSKVYAQLSPSGQAKVITPSILSACAADTIWVELTNKNGPSCIVGAAPVPDAQIAITLPGNGEVTYQSGTVDSDPGGATEVSFTGNVLTMDIPVPSFGQTTRAWFVLNSSCEVTGINPLPTLNLSATYPAAFNTPTESWESAQMNTGQAEITFVPASTSQNSIIKGFNQTNNYAQYVTNTGFGKITKLTYHQIVHDSLTNYISGNDPRDHIYLRRRNSATSNTPLQAFSQKYDTYPNGQSMNLGNGYRMYSFDLEGIYLDREDGEFNPGDRIQINASYLRMPESCIEEMFQYQWITYECIGGGATCNTSVDTLTREYRINAGTPIVGGSNSVVEPWDGCPDKNASFTYVNTGVPNPAIPEQSVAYDVELGVNLKGKLFIDNLLLAGTSVVGTPTTPGNVKSFSWNLKDVNTVDFDGPGGIQDLDGDGYFDDLAPGDSITVSFTYTLDCDAACGLDLYYDIKAVSSFTDFCRNLNGATTTPLYEFGFEQTSPIEQVTPLPNYGTMSGSDIETRQADFTFNYQGVNVNSAAASTVLRINYSKTMTIKEPIVFMGTTIPLSSFTQIGAGSLDTTGYNNTADVDSALEYTLTAAQVAALVDNTPDDLSYWVSHISCDSFQSQTNKDGWQLLYRINSSPCPAPSNAVPCELDLACNKAFVYQITEGCGSRPCYRIKDSIYRSSLTGFTDENETTPVTPTAQGTSKFYEGDTLTFLRTAQLSGDYPVMEPIGGTLSPAWDLRSYFSFSYNKDPNKTIYDMVEPAYEFIPGISRVRVIDTTTNTVIHDIPLDYKDFQNASGFTAVRNRGPNDPLIYWTNTTNSPSYAGQADINSVPGVGLGDYWCGLNTWILDGSACPYADLRTRAASTTTYQVMQNDAKDRLSEAYYIHFGRALAAFGINFEPGYSKYVFEVDTKWRVNPDYDHQNISSLRERGGVDRRGNGSRSIPAGTFMAACNTGQSIATAVTSELVISNAGATYSAACNLTVCNNIDFQTVAGDFMPGEVRVPFKMDSIVVDMPTEYSLTAPPTFTGTAVAPTNSIVNSATTGRITFTNNTSASGTTYPDFPRHNDANGSSTVWSICYPVSNAGSDNFITQSYKVPVTYYAHRENGDVVILVDTFNITETDPVISVAPLGGTVRIEDGGACANSYMDVLVSNNTIYAASNLFIAAESNPNVTVVNIEDAPGETPADPIDMTDTSSYGASNLYAELGGMAAGGRRIVRIYFNTTSCTDSLKIFSNFGCNYPVTKQPEYPSPTLDSAFIIFNSVAPSIMSGPIDGNKNISNLCDIQTLEVEVRNVKNANLTDILAGIKLPPNAVYVASSAEIAYPTNLYVAAPTVTVTGTDSITIDISSDLNLAQDCGLEGPDKGRDFWTGTIANNASAPNAVRFRFDVDFTACPTGNSDAVYYDVRAQNYCGTEVESKGVFNLIYTGTVQPNEFSAVNANAGGLPVCADIGTTNMIVDSVMVMNVSGPATSGTANKLEITIDNDTTNFELTNFTAAAPWGAPTISTTPEGRTVLLFTVPAGIAASGSSLLVLNYDLTPKVANVCSASPASCGAISLSYNFYSEVTVDCAAKSLSCGSLGEVSRGTGTISEELECCPQGLGDRVWLDTDEDGIQDPGEVGVAGVQVDLYDNGPDGLPNTADDVLMGSTVTDGYGNYYFDDIPMGDYNLGFTPPANYTFTTSVLPGDNSQPSNSDVDDTPGSPNFGRTGTYTLTAGEQDSTIDAGLILPQPDPTASVGNFVWFDADGDGFQDPNEVGISGVTVTLLDSAGNVVATTVTDGNGGYLFDDVEPGTYSVQFTSPVGMNPTLNLGGVAGATNSDMDPNTNTTAPFVVNAGDSITTVDAGFVLQDPTKASLGDKVFYDSNNDGIQDPGESGVAGVTVYLYAADGTTILDSTVTDALGNYIFNNLDAGDYVVGFEPSSLPPGFVFSPQNAAGSDSTNDSDAGVNGKTGVISLAAGEKNMTVDAGIDNPVLTNSIGDYVWYDINKDGIQDASEVGVAGVTVTLYDSAGAPIATTVTDANGFYLFPELANGQYNVGFSNFPPGYGLSAQGAGTDSLLDSDANPVTGLTDPVVLTGNTNITDLDAGISNTGSSSATASLGDQVFVDLDGDGIQDPGETGLAGVTVYLYAADGVTVLDSTVTDANGNYIFTNLDPGGYVVGFDLNTLPPGYAPTTQDAGGAGGNANDGTDGNDSDADPLTGLTSVINLGPGDDNLGVDMGVTPPVGSASLGNYVWYDENKDGIQDANEVGAQGVQVDLLDSVGNVIATTTTNSDGYYSFTGLAPGTYSVQFSQYPSGYELSPQNAGSSDVNDSDADPITGQSPQVTLAANENNTSLDAGIFSDTKAALGDYVWFDTDGDGIQDPDELPIPGVLVTLYDATGTIPIATTVTDADGKYWFPNLDPDIYTVGFDNLPSGTVFTTQETAPGADGSDVDPNTGRTGPIVLGPGDVNSDIDAGVTTQEPAGLGNYVWNDLDEDGIQDPGEPGVAGVLVTLYGPDGTTVLATTTTDGNGAYSFTDLPPGDYIVGFSNFPLGMTPTQTVGSQNDGDNSDLNPASGLTNTITLTSGEYNPNIDAGLYIGVPLPADGFRATYANLQGKTKCSVNWMTLSEENSEYFVIERSINGKDFVSVGRATAGGNTSVQTDYEFVDDIQAVSDASTIFYRIALIDIDQQFEYSNVISVKTIDNENVIVYPSPFEDELNVTYNADETGDVDIYLTDLSGKTLHKERFTIVDGTNRFQLNNLENLAAGQYFLKFVNSETKREFIIKIQKK